MRLHKHLQFDLGESCCVIRPLSTGDITDDYVLALRQETYLVNRHQDFNKSDQEEYLSELTASPDRFLNGLYVDKCLVGTAGIQTYGHGRFDNTGCNSPSVTIGYLVFGERRRGFGKALLWGSAFLAHALLDIRFFKCTIALDNTASRRMCASCGFREIEPIDLTSGGVVTLGADMETLRKPDEISSVLIGESE